MSNDKVDATFHPGERRVYQVVYRHDEDQSWYECPICGRLSGAVLKGHGFEHIIDDASQ